MTEQSLETLIESIAQNARKASLELVTIPAETKNQFLNDLAKSIEDHYQNILDANQKDLDNASEMGLSDPMIERLTFTKERIYKMAEGVRQVAKLQDPVGEEIEQLSPLEDLI